MFFESIQYTGKGNFMFFSNVYNDLSLLLDPLAILTDDSFFVLLCVFQKDKAWGPQNIWKMCKHIFVTDKMMRWRSSAAAANVVLLDAASYSQVIVQ